MIDTAEHKSSIDIAHNTSSDAAFSSNPEAQLALRFIRETNHSVFLTGKAGTGKTTLLRHIQANPPKRLVVAAPTGVAAINARGVTLHSLFQLPFGPFIPNDPLHGKPAPIRMSGDKLSIIKSLDLLIIDEISMVRADTLDRVDQVLRQLRNNEQPFGGVQLLLIGDLHQLSPVVKNDEQALLRQHYHTPYFFSARVFHSLPFTTLSLKKIYRQQDETFIQLLNEVRNNQLSPRNLELLNERYCLPEALPQARQIITLTTHNKTANAINEKRLEALKGKAKTFTATVKDDYPAHAYPAPETLTLKVGAQVMFVRNDTSGEKRFYNGKIGIVKSISREAIQVRCDEDDATQTVERSVWENIVYTLNAETQDIETTVEGTFEQFPLRLAWAITIHKSQGLTFKDVIIDAESSFAHGQVYVALSRCQTLEGIILQSRIPAQAVRTDGNVNSFSRASAENPTEQTLAQARDAYQKKLIGECFSFSRAQYALQRLVTLLESHSDNMVVSASKSPTEMLDQLRAGTFDVAQRFKNQLNSLYQGESLPEESPAIQERIRKACAYFGDQLQQCEDWLNALNISSDNKENRAQYNKLKKQLLIELGTHNTCLSACKDGFNTQAYLKARATAPLKVAKRITQKTKSEKPETQAEYLNSQIKHPILFNQLKSWRDKVAEKLNNKPHQVIHQKLLVQVAVALPLTKKDLSSLQGFSKNKVSLYGETLLKMVRAYCEAHNVTPPSEAELIAEHPLLAQVNDTGKDGSDEALSKKKIGTREQSLLMQQQGKSISEIAQLRSLTESTIKGHMAHYIKLGELNISDFLAEKDISAIRQALESAEDNNAGTAKQALNSAYDYGDIRLVQAHLATLETT
jgi:hypothetical protein